MNQTCTGCGAVQGVGATACPRCGAVPAPPQGARAAAPAAPVAPVRTGVVQPGAFQPGAGDYVSADHGHTSAPPATARRRRRSLAVGAGGLALAVGAAGLLSWSVLGDGGASTPEAAAEQFFSAVAAQDVVAALDVVLPGEVEGAADVFEAQRKEAVEKKEMPEEGITEAVEITASSWEFDVDEVADHVALVTLEDTDLSVTWDLGKLESTKVSDSLDGVEPRDRTGRWPNATGGYAELKAEMAKDGITPTVVTVEEDGRWYVSFLGTVQNSIFQAEHHDGPDETFAPSALDWATVSKGHAPVTGKDSREVVEQVLTAIRTADVETGLAMLPQRQVRALWASWGVLEQAVADELAKDDAFLGLELELLDWDAEEKEIGDDLVEVRVTGAKFRAAFDDEGHDPEDEDDFDESFEGTLTFADGCFAVGSEGDTAQGCLDEVEFRGDAFPDDAVVLMMRRVDGGLQLDPLATLVHYQSKLDFTEAFESLVNGTYLPGRVVDAEPELYSDEAWSGEGMPGVIMDPDGDLGMDELDVQELKDAGTVPVPELAGFDRDAELPGE